MPDGIPLHASGEMAEPDLDQIHFGDTASEHQRGFKDTSSEVIVGGLNQSARRLLGGGPNPWEGGSLAWTMKIDPARQNYLTVKFWGSDKGYAHGRLILFANGLQVGYRHESDHDLLNQLDDDPLAPGRFVYVTVPLPPMLTTGKSSIDLQILATGPIWFYGANFAQYQKPFTGPSRGIYRAYTHTAARFVPAADEAQGSMPDAPVRATDGPEVIAQSRDTVIRRLQALLDKPDIPANPKTRGAELDLLAEAYHTPWSPAARDPRAITRIVRLGDAMAVDFIRDHATIEKEWNGAGPLGQAVVVAAADLRPRLEEMVEASGKQMRRADLWAMLLKHSIDHWRMNRRFFTNQSMIVDAGIHASNRALHLIDPSAALPEAHTLGFLYQSTGITPWVGNDTAAGSSEFPYGRNYHLITRKGLSRELGYVGSYGETILMFARDMAVATGDVRLREQTRKMQLARLVFRYPSVDEDGYRCMKLVSEIDNRVSHYPYHGSAYTAPAVREAWWMETAALLPDDPAILGAARQSIEDGQYFHYIASRMKDPDTLGMLRNVNQWDVVGKLPASPRHLPMSPGQPDFVFADEENAVVAIKHGESRLFINFYFRAERAVNRVARVFELSPTITRIATVCTDAEIIPSGASYTRPDWTDRIRHRGINPPGQSLHQAWAGEVLPIAKRPDDAKSPAYGELGPFVGLASFYSLRYGDYLIGLNTTDSQAYTLAVPPGISSATDLVTGKSLDLGSGVPVGPRRTVVLHLTRPATPTP